MTSLLSARDKLTALRSELTRLKVDGFIVPHADEYQSEYLPASSERLAWLTGFTGSSGAAAILPDQAAAMTDGRYLIQIARQVDKDLYEIVDIIKAGVADWFSARGSAGQKIGYDPKLHTVSQIKTLEEKLGAKGMSLVALAENPLDTLWSDRGAEEIFHAEIFPEQVAGRSSADKRTSIAAELKEKGIASAVITLPDSIAWLLNIRGRDIPHNPLVLSYAVLHAEDARLDWYVDSSKITPDLNRHLGNTVTIKSHGSFEAGLKGLNGTVLVDFDRSSQWVVRTLKDAGIAVKDGADPSILPKALKTQQEQDAMRAAHIRDGVAVTKFLYWFETEVTKGTLTELAAEEKLLEFRQQQKDFRMTSFDTIAGWADHGAIIHYRATPETNSTIAGNGLFLLDSGAQYQDGTTDITRTIGVGTPTAEMKDRFTRVLKAHIAVARARFPEGTAGTQIDALARAPLWDAGLDFAHGTGHGVGVYLCVHEESVRLSSRGHSPAKPGMIVSNEPGFYKEGEFGIRCENLILCIDTGEVCSDGRAMLAFETITLAPFDTSLIVADLLTGDEKAWLSAYHQKVVTAISPFLTRDEQDWLKRRQ